MLFITYYVAAAVIFATDKYRMDSSCCLAKDILKMLPNRETHQDYSKAKRVFSAIDLENYSVIELYKRNTQWHMKSVRESLVCIG